MITYLDEIGSTNTYLQQLAQERDLPHLFTVCTFRQTAGRGQRGNGWESEPDKNISFTTAFDTRELAAERLWQLSMLVALSVKETLCDYGLDATIKWPNDIYVGDKKICGILIENVIQGSAVRYSLAGVGVNVNQEVFVSNAPNPTSMRLLTGKDFDKKEVLSRIVDRMDALWQQALDESNPLKERYMQSLYRREGEWEWKEVVVTTAPMMIGSREEGTFMARISDVSDTGQLVLQTADGKKKTYHFKEIKYILS